MIGIDEVGRGAWAGPLLVCAARLNKPIEGLKDSKKLSAKQRQILDVKIRQTSDIGFGWIPASQIDQHGLAEALRMATAAALEDIGPEKNEQIIIDGSVNFAEQYPNVITAVRADDTFPVVSAASIVAKVARDEYMKKLSESIRGYGFEAHVGYGTARHTAAIKELGLRAEHRRSFRLPS
jgi:ribonuclease HII